MSGAGLSDPISYPQTWDVVVIAGQTSPGLCEVSEFKRAHEWDVKKGKGTLGATITFVSKPPAKGSVTFKAWTAAHFAAWDIFYSLFKYDPTKKTVTGVDIYHPSLADIELNAVVTESIGNWVHKGAGLYERVVEFLEFFPTPPKPAVGTAGKGASYTNPDSKKGGTQPDDADASIQKGVGNLTGAAGP